MVADTDNAHEIQSGFLIGFVVLVPCLSAVIVTMPVMLSFSPPRRRFQPIAGCILRQGRNEQCGAILQAFSRVNYRLSVCIGGGRMLKPTISDPGDRVRSPAVSLDDEVERANPVFVGIVMAVGGNQRSAGKYQRTENSGNCLSEIGKVAVLRNSLQCR